MAHLTDTFYTRAPVSPRTAPSCSSLDPCKPLTSNRAQSSFLIQHTQGQLLHPRQSHKPAPSRSSGGSSCLLYELEVWALSLPRFLLAAAVKLSTVPSGPHTAAWRRCECNLLLSCSWLELGLWLLSLRLWRDEKLDLLGADGDFIRLKPPFEMFQGALIRIKSIHKKF